MTEEAVLVFAGAGESILAERLLLGAGLAVKVMPVPGSIRSGCGLCLRLPTAESGKAREVLAGSGIFPQLYGRNLENGKSTFSEME